MIESRWTVLVCEDSDEDFDTLTDAVRKSGLAAQVDRVTTGGACLDLLRVPGGSLPTLVLMDLNTPGTDGREALVEIRADDRLRGLPVVVLSTSGSPRDVEFCYKVGANAYHVKPVRYTDHIQVIQDVFAYWLGKTVLSAPRKILP